MGQNRLQHRTTVLVGICFLWNGRPVALPEERLSGLLGLSGKAAAKDISVSHPERGGNKPRLCFDVVFSEGSGLDEITYFFSKNLVLKVNQILVD